MQDKIDVISSGRWIKLCGLLIGSAKQRDITIVLATIQQLVGSTLVTYLHYRHLKGGKLELIKDKDVRINCMTLRVG